MGAAAFGLALSCGAQAASDSQYLLVNAFVDSSQETLGHLSQDCSALPAEHKDACAGEIKKLQFWVDRTYQKAFHALATRNGPGPGVLNEEGGLEDSANAAAEFVKQLAVFYKELDDWHAASAQTISQK